MNTETVSVCCDHSFCLTVNENVYFGSEISAD